MSVDIQTNPNQSLAYTTSYKAYVALLSQSGTDAPVATVLNANDSNFLGNIVWSYSDVGTYHGTLTGAFPATKTATIFGANGAVCFLSGNRNSNNEINVQTNDTISSNADGLLYELYLEIRVYP